MKIILLSVLFWIIAIAVFAQEKWVPVDANKKYLAVTIMPDGTFQKIILDADENAKQEFVHVALANTNNTAPITLQQRMYYIGQTVNTDDLSSISESDAYRFLANQLCESCSVQRVVSKNVVTFMCTHDSSGRLMLIQTYWDQPTAKWIVNVSYTNVAHQTFKIIKPSRFVY
ncbi:MAG: hypothetical protein ABIO57_03625 [Candidatus Paceibacterota bacterium]